VHDGKLVGAFGATPARSPSARYGGFDLPRRHVAAESTPKDGSPKMLAPVAR